MVVVVRCRAVGRLVRVTERGEGRYLRVAGTGGRSRRRRRRLRLVVVVGGGCGVREETRVKRKSNYWLWCVGAVAVWHLAHLGGGADEPWAGSGRERAPFVRAFFLALPGSKAQFREISKNDRIRMRSGLPFVKASPRNCLFLSLSFFFLSQKTRRHRPRTSLLAAFPRSSSSIAPFLQRARAREPRDDVRVHACEHEPHPLPAGYQKTRRFVRDRPVMSLPRHCKPRKM